MLVVAVVSAADLAAAAAVVEVRARTAPALTALAQRLRDAARADHVHHDDEHDDVAAHSVAVPETEEDK